MPSNRDHEGSPEHGGNSTPSTGSSFDSADLWLASLRAAGRSPKTTEGYAYATDQLKEWRGDGRGDLTTVTRIEALAFVRHLTDTYQPGGVHSRVKRLRALWGWMVAEELVTENVFARVRVTVPPKEQPALADDTLDAMLASARRKPRDLAVITLLADTGARKGELANLLLSDVDLAGGGVIHIRISKTQARTVPLTDRAVVAVGKWIRRRGTASGNLWAVQDPYSLMTAVCRRHSDGTVTPHQFRRRFAIAWLSKSGTESGLMRIAGWSSTEMIRVYTASQASRLAADEFRRLMG